MRLPNLSAAIPPAWRGVVRGRVDPWLVVAVVAGIAGASWLLSPAETAQKAYRASHDRRSAPAVNRTGRILGYEGALPPPGRVVDPIDVLTRRAQLVSHTEPRYMARRLPEYRRAPASYQLPLRGQDFRGLGAQVQVRGGGEPAPAVALTAADVFAAQRGERPQ